ncbi:MAG: glycosyltransferase family 4 protein, partial [Patescibacteria group bacterium]
KYIFPVSLHMLGYSETLTDDKELKLIMWFLAPFMYFFGTIALLRLVKLKKIEIVNAHWILPNGFIASIVSLFTGVLVVSSLPGSDVYMAKKNFLFSWMAKFAVRVSKAITSNSPQLISDLERVTGINLQKKSTPIIYGVDPSKFKPDRSWNAKLRSALKIPSDAKIVLGVGRLVAKKGFEYLIKAAPKILSKSPKTFFVVVGDGDLTKYLHDLTKKLGVYHKFRFTGWVNYEDLKHYYNLADIFILPSIRDEKGNLDDQSVSVVEAMACGKPVVTSNFPGYKVVVENEINGFLTDQKSVTQLARTISKLASSKKLRDEMGRKGRERILSYFSWTAIGKEYSQIFRRVREG